jgi:hypothetical protein
MQGEWHRRHRKYKVTARESSLVDPPGTGLSGWRKTVPDTSRSRPAAPLHWLSVAESDRPK